MVKLLQPSRRRCADCDACAQFPWRMREISRLGLWKFARQIVYFGATMKHLREELWFNAPHRRDYVNITPQVEELVTRSGVRNGLALVNAMHITASVYINDDESGLL